MRYGQRWSALAFAVTVSGCDLLAGPADGAQLVLVVGDEAASSAGIGTAEAGEGAASQPSKELVLKTAAVLKRRLAEMRMRNAIVAEEGADAIRVTLPRDADVEQVGKVLTRPARLQLLCVDEVASTAFDAIAVPVDSVVRRQESMRDAKGNTRRDIYFEGPSSDALRQLVGSATPPGRRLLIGESGARTEDGRIAYRTFLVDPRCGMTGDFVADASVVEDRFMGGYDVGVTLTPEGARLFEQITANHVGDKLALVLDGRVATAPVIMEKISDGRLRITLGAGLSGERSRAEARSVQLILKAGPLPASLTVREVVRGRE
jgi:preprotein translocase subunit SecD